MSFNFSKFNFLTKVSPSQSKLMALQSEFLLKQNPGQDKHVLCFLRESPLRILRVAEQGNVKELRRILSGDPSRLEVHDSRGRRAVHQAAGKNQAGILKIIVEYGGDLNVEDSEGNTPLHVAVEEEAVEAIEFLLQYGVDTKKQNSKLCTPLHLAAEGNKVNSLKILSHYLFMLDVDQSGPLGRTPLHLACMHDRSECVRILIEDLHVSPKRACLHSSLPVHEAAKHGSSKSLEVLLRYHNKIEGEELINLPDAEGNLPLHLAIHGGDIDTVKICLEAGAKISTPQKELSTAVHLACAQGSLDMVKLMFELQPEEKEHCLNTCDLELLTPLHYAAMYDHKDIVECLVNEGANIHCVDKNRWTPLHMAATHNAWQSVKKLIKLGGEPGLQDKNGCTALHLIVKFNGDLNKILDDENIHMFLSILETPDKRGNTALHVAARNGHIKSLAKLVKMGSSITANNCFGESPFHIACRYKRMEIILHLIQHPHISSVINDSNSSGCTPFHIAANEGHDKILEILMKKGAFLRRDHKGRTPLHLAALNGHVHVVKLILSTHSHLIDLTDKVGNTALHDAAGHNRPKVADLLLGLNCQLTLNKEGYSAIDLALVNKFIEVTYVMVTHSKRSEEILELNQGKHSCIMVTLIEKMPGVAKAVLDKSVKKSDHEKCDSPSYKVEYDFKWLTLNSDSGSQKFLPILNEMVKHGRVNLLSHDLTTKYLEMKWNAYGKYFQFFNLFLYLIYLSFQTIVATSYYNKDRQFFIQWRWLHTKLPINCNYTGSYNGTDFGNYTYNENNTNIGNSTCSSTEKYIGSTYNHDEYLVGRVEYGHTDSWWRAMKCIENTINIVAIVNIIVEVTNIFRHGFQHCQDLATWVWLIMNTTTFLTTIYWSFEDVGKALGYHPGETFILNLLNLLFNPGMAITAFLSWFYLFLIMERFDAVGLYVSMFLEILKTMTRFLIVFSILILAFSVTFYIMLSNGHHIGFSNLPLSVVRTFSMMLGDLDFMNTFLYPYHCANMEANNRTDVRMYAMATECKNYARRIPHPYATFPMMCLYMIFMPIVMINLLIGLAVGDIDTVRKNAQLKRLSMQVRSHTNLEKLLPNCFLEKIESLSKVEYPNLPHKISLVHHMIQFFQPAPQQKADEDVNIESDDLKDTLASLSTDMENVKGMIQLYCPMIQMICQKMNINLEDYAEEQSPAGVQSLSRKRLRRALSPVLTTPAVTASETFDTQF